MELTLWRWSTTVQVVSCLLVMAFFAAFARSARTPETRAWSRAWLWNGTALAVTAAFWSVADSASADYLLPPLRFVYLATKILFVVTLLRGAAAMASPDGEAYGVTRRVQWGILLYALVGGIISSSIPLLGIVGSVAIGTLMLLGGAWMFQTSVPGIRWLAVGFLVRGAVAALEGMAYVSQLEGWEQWSATSSTNVSRFLSASSSFDSGAEWLVALGCVLVSMHRARAELESTNRELLAAQDSLRAAADRDPLTGLLNRRALSSVRASLQPLAGHVAFFDLDDFKRINDEHGHDAGDAALVRFADALRQSFRAEDLVYRYAGDEFLVIAPGLSSAAIAQRVTSLREALAAAPVPPLQFAVGLSELSPGSSVEAAIKMADASMYAGKSRRIGA